MNKPQIKKKTFEPKKQTKQKKMSSVVNNFRGFSVSNAGKTEPNRKTNICGFVCN